MRAIFWERQVVKSVSESVLSQFIFSASLNEIRFCSWSFLEMSVGILRQTEFSDKFSETDLHWTLLTLKFSSLFSMISDSQRRCVEV